MGPVGLELSKRPGIKIAKACAKTVSKYQLYALVNNNNNNNNVVKEWKMVNFKLGETNVKMN